MLQDEEGFLKNILQKTNADLQLFASNVFEALSALPTQSPAPPQPGLGRTSYEVVNKAYSLQKEIGDTFLAADVLFQACLGSSECPCRFMC